MQRVAGHVRELLVCHFARKDHAVNGKTVEHNFPAREATSTEPSVRTRARVTF